MSSSRTTWRASASTNLRGSLGSRKRRSASSVSLSLLSKDLRQCQSASRFGRNTTHNESSQNFSSVFLISANRSVSAAASSTVAAIDPVKVGDKFPSDVSLSYFDADGSMQTIRSKELTADKKVVLFAVPGAFTPTCSLKHLPGFIEKAAEIKSKGVDVVACVAVNDAFVMDAWGKSVQADGKVMMIADGSAELAKSLGVELDLNDKGLGMRSRRYVMLVDNGTITHLNLEEGGSFTFSSAEDIMKIL